MSIKSVRLIKDRRDVCLYGYELLRSFSDPWNYPKEEVLTLKRFSENPGNTMVSYSYNKGLYTYLARDKASGLEIGFTTTHDVMGRIRSGHPYIEPSARLPI